MPSQRTLRRPSRRGPRQCAGPTAAPASDRRPQSPGRGREDAPVGRQPDPLARHLAQDLRALVQHVGPSPVPRGRQSRTERHCTLADAVGLASSDCIPPPPVSVSCPLGGSSPCREQRASYTRRAASAPQQQADLGDIPAGAIAALADEPIPAEEEGMGAVEHRHSLRSLSCVPSVPTPHGADAKTRVGVDAEVAPCPALQELKGLEHVTAKAGLRLRPIVP